MRVNSTSTYAVKMLFLLGVILFFAIEPLIISYAMPATTAIGQNGIILIIGGGQCRGFNDVKPSVYQISEDCYFGEIPPDPKCGEGKMAWPKTGACVPDSCEKEGYNMIRDKFGNCVARTGPCDMGYIRDNKGNCIPNIENTSDNKSDSGSGNIDGKGDSDPLTEYFNYLSFVKNIWDYYHPDKGYGPTSVTFSSDGTVTECINKYGNIECFTGNGNQYNIGNGNQYNFPTPSVTTECIYNEIRKVWECNQK